MACTLTSRAKLRVSSLRAMTFGLVLENFALKDLRQNLKVQDFWKRQRLAKGQFSHREPLRAWPRLWKSKWSCLRCRDHRVKDVGAVFSAYSLVDPWKHFTEFFFAFYYSRVRIARTALVIESRERIRSYHNFVQNCCQKRSKGCPWHWHRCAFQPIPASSAYVEIPHHTIPYPSHTFLLVFRSDFISGDSLFELCSFRRSKKLFKSGTTF